MNIIIVAIAIIWLVSVVIVFVEFKAAPTFDETPNDFEVRAKIRRRPPDVSSLPPLDYVEHRPVTLIRKSGDDTRPCESLQPNEQKTML